MKKRVLVLVVCLIISGMILQGLPHDLQATAYPTSNGMMEFAVKAMSSKWGYVYGTYGQMITQKIVDGKRNQYVDVFAQTMSDGRTAYDHALEWIGGRAVDCAGLMKAYLWWQDDTIGVKYVGAQDQSANGIYNTATVKGPISTIPNTHGVLVWRSGHIGVYIGNGEVIESRGVEYGVVKTRLGDRNWTNWCRYKLLTYPTTGWIAINGQQYYYNNGSYVTGLQTIADKTWLFGSDGVRIFGFQTVNGRLRYFPNDGSQFNGWQTLDGTRYYLDANSYILTGMQTIEGKRYLFSNLGVLLTGWQQADHLYFLTDAGMPTTGNITIGTQSLNFDANGQLLTGWQQIDDGWLMRSLSGKTLKGLQLVGDQIYYLNAQGLRQSGWQTIDGRQYYFDPASGARLSGGLKTIESKPRLLAASGALVNEQKLVWSDGHIYLSDTSGHPLTGQQTLSAFLTPQTTAQNLTLQFDGQNNQLQTVNQQIFSLNAPVSSLVASVAPISLQLKIKGTAPEDATWLSLNPSVATVSQTGLIKSVGAGQTLIALLGSDQSYAVFPITVLPNPTTLSLTQQSLVLEPGMAAELPVKNLPIELLGSYRLTSSNPDVANILADGRQVVKQSLPAEISLWQGDTRLLTWTVRGQMPLLGLSIAQTKLHLPVGGRFDKLVSLIPARDTNQTISYTSTNPSVGIVHANGSVKALAAGSTTLTATSGSFAVKCELTVSGQFPLLKRGSIGESVRQLQQKLSDLGYLAGVIDGQFGSLTEFAVTALQKKMNLPLDGLADHSLQNLLQDDLAPAATALQTAGILRGGDTGEQVFVMQTRLYELNFLKSNAGGNFGPLTLQAVKTLQVLNGLPETGITSDLERSLLYNPQVVAGKSVLALGATGYEVLILQQRLTVLNYYSGPLNGIFSNAVDLAVRAFQLKVNLTADGEAGYSTQSRLFASTAPTLSETMTLIPAPTSAPVLTPLPVPVSAPALPSAASYRLGSSGEGVRLIQLRLIALGHLKGVADGKFGQMTTAAARSFQRSTGLTADGILGSLSLAKLFNSTAGASEPVVTNKPVAGPSQSATLKTPTLAASLRIGSRGDAVYQVQLRLIQLGFLKGSADGKFGSMTKAAVIAFQRKAGLTMDGIIGSKSISRLFDLSAF